MRDIVVHNYDMIDKAILWDVAIKEIPKLNNSCKILLKKEAK